MISWYESLIIWLSIPHTRFRALTTVIQSERGCRERTTILTDFDSEISLKHVSIYRVSKENISKLIHPKHVSYKDNTLPDATVMTATDQVEAVLVHGEAGDTVQVSHHTVNHLEQKIFTILSKNICHLTWPVVLSQNRMCRSS